MFDLFLTLEDLRPLVTLVTLHKKMKFSIKDFSSKCEQIHSFLRICSNLLKKSLMENLIFLCSVK